MDQRIIDLFDEYTHKPLSREIFIKKLTELTGSFTAALAILPLLEVNYAKAETIQPQDERLITDRITYEADGASMKGYMAQPRQNRKMGSVIVIHENRGLNAHIEDVTRRVALAGFIALAPDALSPHGGTPENADDARNMFQNLDMARTISGFAKGFDYLNKLSNANGRTGAVGFCWGGALANGLAVSLPRLTACVSFYGRQPDLAEAGKIRAALQLHYAEMDERINAGIEGFEEILKREKITYELYRYPGTQHAFHNDTAPTRYNKEAAELAWSRTVDFFRKHLT